MERIDIGNIKKTSSALHYRNSTDVYYIRRKERKFVLWGFQKKKNVQDLIYPTLVKKLYDVQNYKKYVFYVEIKSDLDCENYREIYEF